MRECLHCKKGVTFEGTQMVCFLFWIGTIKTINGVPTYVAKSKGWFPKTEALILLTDIFGLPLVNNKLLADDFANYGWDTFVPDYLNGDAVPADGLNDPNFNLTAWSANHTEAVTLPVVLNLIEGLKQKGYNRFLTTGYCFGGKYAVRLAQRNDIKVSTMAHPSALVLPDDFNTLLEKSKVPIQINSAELDNAFNLTSQALVDSLMGDGKYKPGYNRTFFKGVAHGFAVRANLSNPIEKAAKEGAFFAAVSF
ncbi:dienelactone hydrolase endo-1,3,1,4-beta-D-glucanase [Atractiella rhizophila]|nr:dienelactone hydrolase endo-1,3,1,4-beta-D-glucanase [Atractiella rhizophila]